MNEIPRSENGIWFLVEEIRVLSLTRGLGPESVKCSWGHMGHSSLQNHQEKKFVLWNDGGFSSLLSLSVMSKISPCPRKGFPCSPLPCPHFSRLTDSPGFCLHCFPLQNFFILRSPRAHPLFGSYHNLEYIYKLESPWILCIMVPTIV